MTKAEAVSTASDRLAAIEEWTRHTFYAAVVAAGFAGVIAVVVFYAAVEYTRAKWAIAEASERMSRSVASQGPLRPTLPSRR